MGRRMKALDIIKKQGLIKALLKLHIFMLWGLF